MQFSTTFAAALLSLAQVILANSEEFGVMSIHSGSPVQMLFLKENGDKLEFGTGSSLTASITDEGKLKFTDGKYAVAQEDGTFKTGSSSEGSGKFAITDGHVTFNGESKFFAIPDGDSYSLSTKSGNGAIDIAISARSASTGTAISSYTPSGASAATTTAFAYSNATTTTVSTSKNTTKTATISTHTENGAVKAGMGTGALAAAIALLL